MALKVLQAGIYPLGIFDGYDAEITLGTGGFKGGEVCTLVGVGIGADKAVKDADGSYGYTGASAGPGANERPVVTHTLVTGTRILWLADEGGSGYGTLFGELVGGTGGQVGTGPGTGTQLGPHTAAGSGKITCWDKPGLYAVTMDNVDTTAGTGLVIGNNTIGVGDPLYATSAGLLTPDASKDFGNDGIVIGRFIEFASNGSLVNTPITLAQAGTSASLFTQVVFHYHPEL